MPERVSKHHKKPPLEERIKDMCDLIESGYDSAVEWKTIRKVHNELAKRDKLTERQQNILDLIKPVIDKYGNGDPEGIEGRIK
jgi:hypothetical protein